MLAMISQSSSATSSISSKKIQCSNSSVEWRTTISKVLHPVRLRWAQLAKLHVNLNKTMARIARVQPVTLEQKKRKSTLAMATMMIIKLISRPSKRQAPSYLILLIGLLQTNRIKSKMMNKMWLQVQALILMTGRKILTPQQRLIKARQEGVLWRMLMWRFLLDNLRLHWDLNQVHKIRRKLRVCAT